MILSWKLFTESQKALTKDSTVANSLAIPMRNIETLVEDGTVAALILLTPNGAVKPIYRPRRLPTQDGSQSSEVFGNAFNQRGMVGPIKIDISQGRFCGILSEADMDAFELNKPKAIPPTVAEAHNLAGESNYYLVSAPKTVPGHFQQQFPEGQLSDVQSALETNGIALSIWIALLDSVDSKAKVDRVRAIVEDPAIQGDLENFIAYGSADVDLSGPRVQVDFDSLECFPSQLNSLKAVFALSPEAGATSPSGPQELTTSKDRHEQQAANKGLTKLSIPFTSASIKDGKVE